MIGGRYSLDREIGRGGMGAVWLGRDEVLGRPVAVKRVGLAPGGSAPDLQRAEREAKIAASLNHAHIVGVFDLVVEDEQQWLVMEYVEGTTLADLVRRDGALPASRVAPIVAQAASALAAAHANGIVHRDVKPSNILVRTDGQVKLTDFGIARLAGDASITQTGMVTGSPAYLAPEVASGKQATAASDVWSLGATVFHALSGHVPYEVEGNVLGALYRIVNEPPPRLEEPGEMEPLLLATMAVDPARRWDMDEVVRFLERAPGRRTGVPITAPRDAMAEGEVTRTVVDPPMAPPPAPPAAVPVPAPPAGPPSSRRAETAPRRRRLLPVLVTLLVVALVAVIVALALQDDPQPGLDGPSSTEGSTVPGDDTPSSPPSTSDSASPEAVTAEEMESFIESYLQTASSDPASGFRQLTPAFQRESTEYDGFWGSVSNPRIISITADPDTLTVSYTYTYQRRGLGRQQDNVSLQLERSGSTFLIAGPV